ncbi:hypothetical protein Q4E93_21380 [Flavitalea sp. BT771]|uniref:hypothetical protein n=1 Tax=Flavitalea sp. BT771 TaxID=3063329 RepID=UPI0026E12B81|nr:hypothetical protein [Flavitalea sp. BT771]MDO6433176.1 hypothetical protein [Flavitalea sp. BT771]MDV6221548.1 hypothetical protein [Flavitalea sp. BT771]
MKKITFSTLIVFIMLYTQSSCRKVFDYIHDHADGHESLCPITQLRALGAGHERDTFNVIYNAHGDPVSLLATNSVPNATNVDQYFRYDIRGRLSDYILTFTQATGVLVWHKYSYPSNNFVTDTVINYTGTVDGPPPIAKESAFGYLIFGYTMDAFGRITKIWSVSPDPQTPPVLSSTIVYDANGNKPLSRTDLTYDNKINPYRTNKIWQFVYNDYSRNNVLPADHSFTPVYNDFGLPLTIPNLLPFFISNFALENTGTQIEIDYACSAPKGPINY